MGLAINGNVVEIDHGINHHLITTEKGNPKIYKVENDYGDIEIFSIFTRLKDSSENRRNRNARKIGDNCPLIYALKGKENLRTNHSTIREMLEVGANIVQKNFKVEAGTSLICTPSTHNLVYQIARKVGDLLKIPVYTNVFEKASVSTAILDLQRAMPYCKSYSEKKDILNQIDILKNQKVLSLKEVGTKHRHHINAVKLNNKVKLDNVVLVDDLVSTGTTLISAKNLLKSNKCAQYVSALSLFSNV